ncbi:phage tail spike protein [Helcococcus kunzii]|uniref:phage tail spike protein n=1 Tax=Helcococcus kunzii TaxID=40091 RepID=UPI0038A938BB
MIFIYDRNEKQIAHLDITPKITEEIGKLRTLEFESEIEFEKGFRVVADNEDRKSEFIIRDVDYEREETKVFSYFCQCSFIENESVPILDKRPNGDVKAVLTPIFADTRWIFEVRSTDTINQSYTNSFYHISVLEAFSETVEKYKVEWITEFKYVGSKITERRVVIYRRDGRSKGRLEFGKNIKKFSRKILPESIVTALYPYGKGEDLGNGTYGRRIGIESVNGGIPYIENKEATEKYGLGEKGSKKPLYGFIAFDEETDPTNLKKEAQKELDILSQVKAEYTVDAIDLEIEAKIGYEVATIDDEISYRGYSRIIKLVKVGDNIEVTFGQVTKTFTDTFQKTLKKTEQGLVEVFEQVNNIKTSADGKTTVFTGASEPLNANEGDMWFRYNADGTVDILFFKNGEWEEETGQKVFKKMQDDLNASKALIDEAKSTADAASQKVDDEVEKMENELSIFKTDTDKVLSIIKDPTKKGLLSAINQQAGGVLIKVGDNTTSSLLNVTKNNVFIDKGVIQQANIDIATITDALLKNVKFDWATGKTLNAQQVNVINLDANNITANKTSFVQSAWNAINSSLTIDGNGLFIDGSWGGAINFTRRGQTFYDKIKGQVMGYQYGLYRNDDDPRAKELMQGIFLGAELGYNLKLGIRTEIYNQNTTFLEISGADRQTTRGTIFGELNLKSNLILNGNSIIIKGSSGVRFGVGQILGNTVTYMVNVQGTAGIGFTMGGGIVVRRYDSKAGATIWKWL